MANIKKYQVDVNLLRKKLKLCNEYMNSINECIGKFGDGENSAKTYIGSIERLNSQCWSDGENASKWFEDTQKNLLDIKNKMESLNTDFQTLDLIENIL